MSFYTSLTGLNAATAQLSVTSNNIANVGTTGFKRSRADFGDIFATSPLQKASSVIGQGVALKQVSQEFSQGNIQFSANSLDIAITGDGFFPLKSADGLQDIYTRNGTFMLNDSYNVVNAAGQALIAASVDSSGKADMDNLSKLLIPRKTTGDAKTTTEIELGLNLPADAQVPTLPFDRNDPTTYNKTTAVTVYDAGGNGYLATVYYRKTQTATTGDPTNKWQTYVYIGDTKLQELLIQSSDKKSGEKQYVNKYGEVRNESDIPPQDIARGVTKLFNLDDLKNPIASEPATVKNGNLGTTLTSEWKNGVEFPAKVAAMVAENPQQGAVYAPVIGATSYSLNTRLPIDSTETTSITTKVVFTPDTTAADTFSIELGPIAGATKVYEGTLPEIIEAINADGHFFASQPTTGKLSIAVTGKSGAAEEILPVPNLVGTTDTGDIEYPPSSTKKILSATFEFDPAATNQDLYLKVGTATYTGRAPNGSSTPLVDAMKSLYDEINADGKYKAELLPDATDPISIKLSVTESDGDPTEIPSNYELSSISSTLTAGSLEDLATDINSRDLSYYASINAAGDMVLLPKDSAELVDGQQVVPQFSMSASFSPTQPYFIKADVIAAKSVSFNAPFLSRDFSLTLDKQYTAASLEDLRDQLNDELVAGSTTEKLYTAKVIPEEDGSKTLKVEIINKQSTTKFSSDTTMSVADLGVGSSPDRIVFDLSVDGAVDPITVDLSYLSSLSPGKKFTGIEIAREITNVINKTYGDERYFDFASLKASETDTAVSLFRLTVGDVENTINLSEKRFGIDDLSKVKLADVIKAVQAEVDQQTDYPSAVTVGYDPVRQSFTFKTADDTPVSIRSSNTANNFMFGLNSVASKVDSSTGTWGAAVLPNGGYVLGESERRYGIEVKFDETNNRFTISSGTTGDTSSIEISRASSMAHDLFGLQRGDEPAEVETSGTPLRGITSTPAVLKGNTIGINLDNKFRVDGSNNQFVVTVDNVTGLIQMPQKADYTMEEFRAELENRINSLADNYGRTVSGVKVEIGTTPGTNNKFFTFTTGTTGDNSFLKVSANSIWGLNDLPSARGTTSKWIEPPQAKNADGFPLYVDRDGLETSDPGTFSEDETRDLWSPIYLDKGELTFDSGGNLFSPQESIAFKSTTIGASGATLQFSIDYASSTQYSSPFSVLKQDQNGRPEGDLIGVDIGDDGLVSASYSNGSQKSLAKIVLVNFASPTGLRQIGDASYYATSKSGDAKYGEAGSAGFGTVRAGARERANVDLTAELVELITAQRNFQANAKAIETNNTLTQAIINIRS
jgi:flagellar hook-basal body protein